MAFKEGNEGNGGNIKEIAPHNAKVKFLCIPVSSIKKKLYHRNL